MAALHIQFVEQQELLNVNSMKKPISFAEPAALWRCIDVWLDGYCESPLKIFVLATFIISWSLLWRDWIPAGIDQHHIKILTEDIPLCFNSQNKINWFIPSGHNNIYSHQYPSMATGFGPFLDHPQASI
jgi:hypothetical protein